MASDNDNVFGSTSPNKSAPASVAPRQRSSSYPRFSLAQVEKLAEIVFEMGPRNCDAERVATQLGYSNAKNGSFVGLRATAAQFGLIVASKDTISVSEEWIKVFLERNQDIMQNALKVAVTRPDLYKMIIDDYKDRQLPPKERLAKELHINQKYGILKDAAQIAAQIFEESAQYAGIVDSRGFLKLSVSGYLEGNPAQDEHGANIGTNLPDTDTGKLLNSDQQPQIPTSIVQPESSNQLDRLEIKLKSGQKAYLFVPVPLPKGEKSRLKNLIDLLLEEEDDDL